MDQKPLSEITLKIRENLLNLANRICNFTDKYGAFIKEDTQELLIQMNQAIQKIPLKN
jgi:hypothetical protein